MSRRAAVLELTLLAAVFAVTFAKLRWTVEGADLNLSDVTTSVFVVGFVASRLVSRDVSAPRTAAVLAALFGLFALVYLVGYFNLDTTGARTQFLKGLAKFALHFGFLLAAVAHIARVGGALYWRVLGAFAAGLVANAAYGVVQLAVAETSGGNLDEAALSPIGAYQKGGIVLFGQVGDLAIYRVNALTLDPNHLGIMLVVPLLILLPLYLRLERGNRLRLPLAVTLGFLFLVELATMSRSGLLGLAAGVLVLAPAYRHLILSRRFLVPFGGVVAVLGVIVAQRVDFFETVLRSRTQLDTSSVRIHLDFYELVPPAIGEHPLFGMGLNTFSTYYEFVTGKTNWGPHSYYVAVLSETGVVGAAVFLAFLGYLFAQLVVLHRLGKTLAATGDALAARVRPLAWGLTGALVGTLAANGFYLTMQMYYFFVLALLVAAAPAVFVRGTAFGAEAPRPRRMRERVRRLGEEEAVLG